MKRFRAFDWRLWAIRAFVVAGLGVQALAILGQPEPGRSTLTLGIGALVGLGFGLRIKHRRFLTQRAKLVDLEERMDAYRIADARTDLDVVGPVAGERPPVERYDPDHEEPLCSWCPDPTPATARIDLPGLQNAPACADHVEAARFGEVTAIDAYPDGLAVTTYDTRLG